MRRNPHWQSGELLEKPLQVNALYAIIYSWKKHVCIVEKNMKPKAKNQNTVVKSANQTTSIAT